MRDDGFIKWWDSDERKEMLSNFSMINAKAIWEAAQRAEVLKIPKVKEILDLLYNYNSEKIDYCMVLDAMEEIGMPITNDESCSSYCCVCDYCVRSQSKADSECKECHGYNRFLGVKALKMPESCIGCKDETKKKLPANKSECLVCSRFYRDHYAKEVLDGA